MFERNPDAAHVPPTLAGLIADRLIALLDKEGRLLKADIMALLRAIVSGLLMWAVAIALIGTGLHLLAALVTALLVTEAGLSATQASLMVATLAVAAGAALARHGWRSLAAQAADLRTPRSLKQDAEIIREVFQ